MYILHVSRSSINTHLGGFYLLATVNNAVMNTAYQSLFKILFSVLLDIYPEVAPLDHTVILGFNF